MEEEGTVGYKGKITEVKQRLNQIYSQSFLDPKKSSVFESEFSLYLKACESARNERTEGIRQQNSVVKTGMTILIAASAFTVYLFSVHLIFGLLIFLGFGFLACGFMYLLLNDEIRIARAGGYCTEIEAYFKQHRWTTEQDQKLHLPTIPMWEEFRNSWSGDLFDDGHYQKRVLYAPFRIAITFINLLAIGYAVQLVTAQQHQLNITMLIIFITTWIVAVVLQMLIVHLVINKVDQKLCGTDKESPSRTGKRDINWSPETWINILRLFFLLDILLPKEPKK